MLSWCACGLAFADPPRGDGGGSLKFVAGGRRLSVWSRRRWCVDAQCLLVNTKAQPELGAAEEQLLFLRSVLIDGGGLLFWLAFGQ